MVLVSINQHYVADNNVVKVIFVTDTSVKDDYIIMPNLKGMSPSDFMQMFSGIEDSIVINGSLKSDISVQENIPGSKVDIKTEKIVLWTE